MLTYENKFFAVEYARSSLSAWEKSRKSSRRARSWDWHRYRWYYSWIGTHAMRAGGSSAVIAKLLAALTGHGWAAVVSLYPKLALGALFVPCSLDKLDEIFIIFVETVIDLVLCAGHAVVVLAFAPQTIVFWAGGALIVVELLVETENCGAASCGTPGGWCMVHFYKFIEWKFLVFLLEIAIDVGVYVSCLQFVGTALQGAIDFDLACLDFALEVAVNALIVEYVSALENAK